MMKYEPALIWQPTVDEHGTTYQPVLLTKRGEPALPGYRVVASDGRVTYVYVSPDTGRGIPPSTVCFYVGPHADPSQDAPLPNHLSFAEADWTKEKDDDDQHEDPAAKMAEDWPTAAR